MRRNNDKNKPFYDKHMPAEPDGQESDYKDPYKRLAGISNFMADQERRFEKMDKKSRQKVAENENRLANPETLEDITLQFGKKWLNSPGRDDVSKVFLTIKNAAARAPQVEVSSEFIGELSKILSKLLDNADPNKGAGVVSLITGYRVQDNAARKLAGYMEDKTLKDSLEGMKRGFKEVGISISPQFEKTLSSLAAALKNERELPIKRDPRKPSVKTYADLGIDSPASTTDDEQSSDDDLSNSSGSRRSSLK